MLPRILTLEVEHDGRIVKKRFALPLLASLVLEKEYARAPLIAELIVLSALRKVPLEYFRQKIEELSEQLEKSELKRQLEPFGLKLAENGTIKPTEKLMKTFEETRKKLENLMRFLFAIDDDENLEHAILRAKITADNYWLLMILKENDEQEIELKLS
jgi:long-subunit acyl-CoA synthetase (AMP-forming)